MTKEFNLSEKIGRRGPTIITEHTERGIAVEDVKTFIKKLKEKIGDIKRGYEVSIGLEQDEIIEDLAYLILEINKLVGEELVK